LHNNQIITPDALAALKTVRDAQLLSGTSVLAAVRPDLKGHIEVRIGERGAVVPVKKVSAWAKSIKQTRPGTPIAINIDGEILTLQCETSVIRFRSQMNVEVTAEDSVTLVERDGLLELPAMPDKATMKTAKAALALSRKIEKQRRQTDRAEAEVRSAQAALDRRRAQTEESRAFLATHTREEAISLALAVRSCSRFYAEIERALVHDYKIEEDRKKSLLDGVTWATDDIRAVYAAARKVVMSKQGRSRQTSIYSLRMRVADAVERYLTDLYSAEAARAASHPYCYRTERYQHHRRAVQAWPKIEAELRLEIANLTEQYEEASRALASLTTVTEEVTA
jgi:hypothetical protein